VVDRLIELELLAREAFEAGMYDEGVVAPSVRRTLARRWLEVNLEDRLGPEQVPAPIVQREYDAQQRQRRYDHYTVFMLEDIQLLCCSKTDADDCYDDLFDDVDKRREHLTRCIDHHEPAIRFVHDLARGQAATREGIEAAFESARMSVPSPELQSTYGARLAKHAWNFEYDINRTWEQQFDVPKRQIKYRVFFKEIMDGVKEEWLRAGRTVPLLTQPLRSRIGWHVMLVHRVVPEEHRPLTDPGVQKEIREGILVPWRREVLAQRLNALCAEVGCEFHHDRVAPLQRLYR
jgi:hypothetical protein